MKYSFAKCNEEGEIFKVDGCDSFDEAIRQVEKGIKDRDGVLAERAAKELPAPVPAPQAKPAPVPPAATTANAGTPGVAPAKPDMVEKYDKDGNVIE